MPSFASTLQKEFFSLRLLLGSVLIAFLYIALSVLLLNEQLFSSLVRQHAQILELLLLFFSLTGGLWTSLSLTDFLLTCSTALLVGINIMMLARTVSVLEHKGKLHLSVGGATLLSLVATGCTSCGLSLVSILGLSASFSFLPFRGMELHVGAVILLGVSTIYMVKQLHNGLYCKIPGK